jgi:hypothetical protein
MGRVSVGRIARHYIRWVVIVVWALGHFESPSKTRCTDGLKRWDYELVSDPPGACMGGPSLPSRPTPIRIQEQSARARAASVSVSPR